MKMALSLSLLLNSASDEIAPLVIIRLSAYSSSRYAQPMCWEMVGIWTAICVAGMMRGGLMARKFKQGNGKEIVI